MNIFTLEIWNDEATFCTFYTVRWEDSDTNETDKFFEKYDSISKYSEATYILLNFVLQTIGEDHGPWDQFFNRNENEVQGLPNKGELKLGDVSYYFPNFPLRLYALKLSDEIVILFNGGVKDGSTNQTSSLNLKWKEACAFAKKINEAFYDGTIIINNNNRTITLSNGEPEIIL